MLSWLNNIYPSLPKHRGPHAVSTTEIEIPIETLCRDHTDPPVPTIKFRLFYPADITKDHKYGVNWIPAPQEQFTKAAFKMAKIGPFLSYIFRFFLWWLPSLQMPVYRDAPVLKSDQSRPVAIFSHGLANWINSSSSILGELASYGMVCVAVEHRDGSAVLSSIRNDGIKKSSLRSAAGQVDFRGISLKIKPGVMEARDEQLRIRIFELGAVYTALELVNAGQLSIDLAGSDTSSFKNRLDLSPGSVTWIGYSFGGTTIIQLLKSIYHSTRSKDPVLCSLLIITPSTSLTKQITTASSVVLLDPWYLPLKSPHTSALYNKPLPAYLRTTTTNSNLSVILSSEFAFHYPECHSHMPAILSADPSLVAVETQSEYNAMMSKYKSPAEFVSKSKRDKARYQSQLAALQATTSKHVKTYVLRDTIHTTLCDYGLIVPWMSYFLGGQRDAVSAMQNVVRCVLSNRGLNDGKDIVTMDKASADAQLLPISAVDEDVDDQLQHILIAEEEIADAIIGK